MIDEKKLIEYLETLVEFERKKSQESAQIGVFDMATCYGHGEYCYKNAINAAEEQPKIGDWIPCSDRLPEEKGWYLVYAKNQRPFVAYFKGKTFPLNNHYHEIAAWMTLPEPYEEKENG